MSATTTAEFTTFADVNGRGRGRPIVLAGAGNIATKTLRRVRGVTGIVDNNPNLQGQSQAGLEIAKPDTLRALDPRPFVVICTTSFVEVGEQLAGYGFTPGTDFVVSPVLNDLRIIAEMEALEETVLFTCGLPPSEDPEAGGGLYELSIKGARHSFRKVMAGNFHGLKPHGEHFIAIDDERGLITFDRDYTILSTFALPQGARCHGVCWSEEHRKYFIACSYLDAILVYDEDGQEEERIAISRKQARTSEAQHHCNDILVLGDSVYLSMFSATGNWKRDVFDGVVLEYDFAEKRWAGPVISDLWMPHSIDFVDGSLVVLDSLRGRLLKNNAQTIGQFPGFARGLAHDGSRFFIGQSRNRNYSAAMGVSNNIAIDTAITVFDEHTKVSKSFHLPSTVSEIHAIALNTRR
ncbi:hypothetical protein GCM10011367_01130 [Marinicauda pacifica]|uniref:DUF4915 domain-containing protein n=1 Tax=Marinicauda pacifica TaxID=1133559 RepID=A0A4S2HDH8_9PROT|nr:DUF4915 domain-containing protein [Marinicauda pacifica]TGY93818.1 DUF4915 domain-containing protein [Marinicauda pacifica]GGE30597.1 hypothetical protein GCM10011367_01130 [Marinicauda pacifica]